MKRCKKHTKDVRRNPEDKCDMYLTATRYASFRFQLQLIKLIKLKLV